MNLAKRSLRVLRKEGIIPLFKKATRFVVRSVANKTYEVGSKRVCPVCGFNGRKFKAAGSPIREGARCPNCNAAERHRLLADYIENETDLFEGGQCVLYFAPVNEMAINIQQYGNRLITTDISMADVDVHADITCLPFEDGRFDTVICSHVLEHILDDNSAISELYRVLSPEGYALIMIPKDKGRRQTYEDTSITSSEKREKIFGQSDHVRWYGKDFPQRLSQAGFEVTVETYGKNLPSEVADKHGLKVDKTNQTADGRTMEYSEDIMYEDIHYCKKD